MTSYKLVLRESINYRKILLISNFKAKMISIRACILGDLPNKITVGESSTYIQVYLDHMQSSGMYLEPQESL